jgi:hypothetical protein
MRLPAALIALLLLPATAGAATVDSGTITVGEGVNGATLGMKRSEVVRTLGEPADENTHGVMSYQRLGDDGILDVYRDPKRVRLFIVSFVASGDWQLADGNLIFKRGGIDRLYDSYGKRVKKRPDRVTGSLYYTIRGHFKGRRVETAFQVDRYSRSKAHVLDVYINYR